MEAAAAAAAGAAAPVVVNRRRPRAAHPESLDVCLFDGADLRPELCCSLCYEPFKQARTRAIAPRDHPRKAAAARFAEGPSLMPRGKPP
jgi:hypothetical protein